MSEVVWWFADCEDALGAVAVRGPAEGWPGVDSSGRQIFENTHFRKEEDAWEHVGKTLNIRMRLDICAREALMEQVARIESMIVEKSVALVKFEENRAARSRELSAESGKVLGVVPGEEDGGEPGEGGEGSGGWVAGGSGGGGGDHGRGDGECDGSHGAGSYFVGPVV